MMDKNEFKDEFKNETDRFIELYKEFEKLIKIECNKVGIETNNKFSMNQLIKQLSKKNSFIKENSENGIIGDIRDVRNINWHKDEKKYKYIACPSPAITDNLKYIVDELKNPPLISKIMIKRDDIFYKTIDSSIYETIKVMSEKLYTHIPIFEGDNLIGVFSENTLLDIVKLNNRIVVNEKTDFSTIREALKIENHSMESFKFVSKKMTIYELEDLFKNYFSDHKRLGCIFVTKNGNKNEKILGMLTAWDVLGN